MNEGDKRRTYDRIAAVYDLLDLPFEHFRYRHLRAELFAGLGGRILDAGVGTGRNIAHYPKPAQVVGVDLSPAMLARARRRAARLGREVELHRADVTELAYPDRHFDGVASSFLFCVLEDALQVPALTELRRVCRPGGTIRILEYALSQDPFRRRIMRLWAPWVRRAYGARFDRNTEQYAEAAGLKLVETRFVHLDIVKLLTFRPG